MSIELIFAGAATWILSEYGKTITEKTAKAAWEKTGQPAWETWREKEQWKKSLAKYGSISTEAGMAQLLGIYELLKEIGKGGFAVAYQ